MELKEITVRYEGPCQKCKREIKVGWTAFFDPEAKHLYCRPCSKDMAQQNSSTEPEPIIDALTEEELAQIPESLRGRLQAVGLVKALTLEDRVKMLIAIIGNLQAIIETFDERLIDISEGQKDLEKLLKAFLALSPDTKEPKKKESS